MAHDLNSRKVDLGLIFLRNADRIHAFYILFYILYYRGNYSRQNDSTVMLCNHFFLHFLYCPRNVDEPVLY